MTATIHQLYPSGWVRFGRQIPRHPCLKRDDARGIWDRLLTESAWKPTPVWIAGETVTLSVGQLLLSVRDWSREGGTPYKRLRAIFATFVRHGMIEMVAAKGAAGTIVTVCNYALYQNIAPEEGAAEGAARAHEGRKKGAESKTERILESKKESQNAHAPTRARAREEPAAGAAEASQGRDSEPAPNDLFPGDSPPAPKKPRRRVDPNAEPEGFPEWWAAYPRKQEGKTAARESYRRALKVIDPGTLRDALARHAAVWVDYEPRFIPAPRRWLGEERWKTDPMPASGKPSQPFRRPSSPTVVVQAAPPPPDPPHWHPGDDPACLPHGMAPDDSIAQEPLPPALLRAASPHRVQLYRHLRRDGFSTDVALTASSGGGAYFDRHGVDQHGNAASPQPRAPRGRWATDRRDDGDADLWSRAS